MARIKGTVVNSSCELMLETHGQAGLERTLAMLDEPDRTLLRTAVATDWYDMDLYCRWLKASVMVACDGYDSRLIDRAARGLSKQLRGVYKVFAFFASPQSVVQRLVAVDRTYFQGISTTVATVARGKHIIAYDGLDPSHRLFEYILIGWWTEILATSRARNARVDLKTSVVTGGRCEIGVSWDP